MDSNTSTPVSAMDSDHVISAYFASVYKWMTLALAITAGVAWQIASSPLAYDYLMAHPLLSIGLMIAQFGLVIWLAGWVQNMSYGTSIVVFMVYAALTGVTFSSIFMAYTTASIFKVFGVTAVMYAVTSLYGYSTKRDLSGFGQFLFMSLIGIVLGSVINLWFQSPMVEWMTTYGGILVFAGLSAWDHQKLKQLALAGGPESMAIRGALCLYLDFINLFLLLLRVLGDRR